MCSMTYYNYSILSKYILFGKYSILVRYQLSEASFDVCIKVKHIVLGNNYTKTL